MRYEFSMSYLKFEEPNYECIYFLFFRVINSMQEFHLILLQRKNRKGKGDSTSTD